MQTQFAQAIEQICEEKNIPKDTVMEAVEAALAAAYKKDYGEKDQEVRVDINEESGAIEVYVSKTIVEEVEDEFMEIALDKAVRLKKDAKVGDVIEIMDLPADFGRIAAQTAKQVIVQRIREAERDIVFTEYQDKEGEIVNCIVQRIEGDTIICDLGKSSAVLYKNEQIPGERYYPNQRFRVFIVKVEQTARGPQIIVSRSHPGMIKKLFESEVPEIGTGAVEIKGIAREAGGRTKIAVISKDDSLDPVGAFVGQRGIRVQAVTNEIGGEKIDIILWDEDLKVYIENAISPAKVTEIELNEKEQKATIKVPEDQLSLAIGKQGQNVRLAAKLTGWNIDIEGSDSAGVERVEEVSQIKPKKEDKKDLEAAILEAVKAQNESEATDAKTEDGEAQADADVAVEPEVVAEVTPEVSEEVTPEVVEEQTSEVAEEATSEVVEEQTSEVAEEATSDVVAEDAQAPEENSGEKDQEKTV